MSVKARKVGNSKVFTIPQNIKPTDGEYEVFQGRHGSIVFSPKKTNIFKDKKFLKEHNLKQKEEFNDESIGEEEID
ncbi:type II toxin-antitoxin system PemI/MazE family antitoxin [Companilactobacillus bobalius]|uniref:Antitoxin of toxin-antitoxin stability system n=1 Tax=Companilactobacillus bobalius TaxID=2801451 RepID=A0A202F9V7_9LACO|nr:hypothetical protein [Companilactobacillus bobalius]KAE9558880.1 antitoxin of toxin-antitoxin stability system [Companilactobacillus bobalius]OVE97227.1 hypothetical protein LKACC16343_01717 [Companilactobacillus bobalius]GEO58728.1 hypothetical protein LBO01_18570 [Companilactobacillus paralimentarius]